MSEFLKNILRILFGFSVLALLIAVLFVPGIVWAAFWPETLPVGGDGIPGVGDAIVMSWIIILMGWLFAVAAWHIGKSFIQ